MSFMIMADLPDTLEENVIIAVRIDNRLANRTMLRQGSQDTIQRQHSTLFVETLCLIDSGASDSFIDYNLINTLQLKPKNLNYKINLKAIDGKTNLGSPIYQCYPETQIRFGDTHKEKITMYPINSPNIPIVLVFRPPDDFDKSSDELDNSDILSLDSEEFFDTVPDSVTPVILEDTPYQPTDSTKIKPKIIENTIPTLPPDPDIEDTTEIHIPREYQQFLPVQLKFFLPKLTLHIPNFAKNRPTHYFLKSFLLYTSNIMNNTPVQVTAAQIATAEELLANKEAEIASLRQQLIDGENSFNQLATENSQHEEKLKNIANAYNKKDVELSNTKHNLELENRLRLEQAILLEQLKAESAAKGEQANRVAEQPQLDQLR
ncbi:hypothetical protein BB559_005163 [Furculomyces boomerangus]|uniref:Peptidase A2 domain-containing protein n=2 Tax=Furculomyces boomerangus TaxID=61424 RepID=A0A2T9YAD4_9FUNG|nr:hypothetical protein BB559_005163 [Furculomyces boomerangus]